jgi:hypothetical protein
VLVALSKLWVWQRVPMRLKILNLVYGWTQVDYRPAPKHVQMLTTSAIRQGTQEGLFIRAVIQSDMQIVSRRESHLVPECTPVLGAWALVGIVVFPWRPRLV